MSPQQSAVFAPHRTFVPIARTGQSGERPLLTVRDSEGIAISKAAELPDAVQEQLGREMLERLDALVELRAAIEVGVQQLDAGEGKELQIEAIIRRARQEHATG